VGDLCIVFSNNFLVRSTLLLIGLDLGPQVFFQFLNCLQILLPLLLCLHTLPTHGLLESGHNLIELGFRALESTLERGNFGLFKFQFLLDLRRLHLVGLALLLKRVVGGSTSPFLLEQLFLEVHRCICKTVSFEGHGGKVAFNSFVSCLQFSNLAVEPGNFFTRFVQPLLRVTALPICQTDS